MTMNGVIDCAGGINPGGQSGGIGLVTILASSIAGSGTIIADLEPRPTGVENANFFITGGGGGGGNAADGKTAGRICPGDLDGNAQVELADLALLLSHFGGPGSASDGDINGDGVVDLSDLAILLSNFGSTC